MDAAASARRWSRRASYLVSEIRRAGRTALMRTAKPCGPDTRGWCQAAGGEFDPTGSTSHQAGSDGGKRNSSPGRARHKPSNHCAGKAGCSPLDLYARVRTSLCTLHTRPRVQRAPGLPCALIGRELRSSLGCIAPRECETVSTVIASERSNPSSLLHGKMDCFASLAMTPQTSAPPTQVWHLASGSRRAHGLGFYPTG